MKNRKITLAVSLLLVFVMIFGTVSASAAGGDSFMTTAPAGYDDSFVTTTPSEVEDAYNDGYQDGYGAGFASGSVNDDFGVPSIFDFIEDLRWRLYWFIDGIRERLIEALILDLPNPDFNRDYLPKADQVVLGEEYKALCEKFNALIEDAHYAKETVSITKTADVDFKVTEITGGSLVEKMINPILETYLLETSSTEIYEEGYEIYYLQDITLYPEGLVSAKETVNADGSTSYEFVLKEEAAYYADYTTFPVIEKDGKIVSESEYLFHDLCADTLMLEWFEYDFEPIQITGASINYPGVTIKATTDAQGRLTALSIDMPVKGAGEFALTLIKGNIAMEGYRNEGYTFEYAA